MTHSSLPPLAPAPGHYNPGPGANAGRLYNATLASRLDQTASALDRAVDGWTMHRLDVIRPATATDPGLYEAHVFPASSVLPDAYNRWLGHVWPAAACTRPVLLRGTVSRLDSATGEIFGHVHTDDLPDGAIYTSCGNRRASVCPGCAETYRRDAYQLIRAGLAGGKGVPETVAGHPAVFATFTAPSFGLVHTRPVHLHTCADRSRCRCKSQPCHARRDADTCPHGRPLACFHRHAADDPDLGQPLCPDCYDYPAHVVWNAAVGELWRRTKQDIERHLIYRAVSLGHHWTSNGIPPVRLSHGKVAEYQARGAVHFHALLRLDGIDPDDLARIVPPPSGLTAADLEHAIRQAAADVSFGTRPHPDSPDGEGWPIAWGRELDVRTIAERGQHVVTGLAVASYLAKYATKGTEDSGHSSTRITSDTFHLYADPAGTHTQRLISACWVVGHADGRMCGKVTYGSLRRWAHMLGYGGHFLTKARRYSVTFTALRQARVLYRRAQDTGPEYQASRSQDELGGETTVILASLSYTGSGWHSFGDALLANTAADQARKRRQTAHEETATAPASPEMPKAA